MPVTASVAQQRPYSADFAQVVHVELKGIIFVLKIILFFLFDINKLFEYCVGSLPSSSLATLQRCLFIVILSRLCAAATGVDSERTDVKVEHPPVPCEMAPEISGISR